jgi:hypothetical protein
MFDLSAGRSAILYHRARKALMSAYPQSYLMPNALKLPESVTENAAEALRTCQSGAIPDRGMLVLSVSSGTVAAGVIKGFAEAGFLDRYNVLLHMGYSRSVETMRAYMSKVSGLDLNHPRFQFVDQGYGYADGVHHAEAPFPCNPYYDRKAWHFLSMNNEVLDAQESIVFWNIGD